MSISSDDPRWTESLQVLTPPRPGGSLVGLFLDAAARNGLPSGELIRATRIKKTGPGRYASPSLLLAGTVLDLEQVATLVGSNAKAIDALTIRPLLRNLDGTLGRASGQGAAPRFRMCGQCCAQGNVPLLHLLADTRGCVRHNRALADACACGEALLPFSDQDPPWTCHGCGTGYAELDAGALLDPETEHARAAVYESLFAVNSRSDVPIGAALGRVLRRRLRGRDMTFTHQRLRNAWDRPSWWLLCDAVLMLGLPIGDIIEEAIQEARRDPHSGPSGSRTVRCPSLTCAGFRRVTQASTRPGSVSALDYVCRRCGTRFTPDRVTFAFDPLPGYPDDRAAQNRSALALMTQRVRAVVGRRLRSGEALTVEAIFREADVPSSQSYRTQRAGLVEIISAAAAGQLRNDLAAALRPAAVT